MKKKLLFTAILAAVLTCTSCGAETVGRSGSSSGATTAPAASTEAAATTEIQTESTSAAPTTEPTSAEPETTVQPAEAQQNTQRPVSENAPAAGDPDYAPQPQQYDIEGLTYIDGTLIANKSYSLPSDFNPGLDPLCESQFNKLSAAAAEEGLNIYLSSGFRSYDYQDQIYNNYVYWNGQEQADTFSARPGYSEHQSGLAIDVNQIDDTFIGTPEAIWLEKHCHEFGFILRYPQGKQDITGYKYESWHIRYVGTDLAYKIHETGLTLEEYYNIDSRYK